MVEKVIKVVLDNTSAVKGIKEVNTELKEVDGTVEDTNTGLKGVSQSALASAKSFKFMGVSINGVSKTLKLLKVSLIATGIGAIVVVVGSLASAFLSTQEGVDALNKVLTPLKEVLDTIWGVAQKLGKGLFQMVSGDVQEGWKTMGDAVENVGEQMLTAWERGTKLYELQKKIEELSVNQNLVLSRQNRLLADSLETAEDITKSIEDRKAAYVVARATQEIITKLKLQELDAILESEALKREANDTDRMSQKELNDLIAQREDIIAQGTKANTLLLKKQNAVREEAQPKGKDREKVVGVTASMAYREETDNLEIARAERELKARISAERGLDYEKQVADEDAAYKIKLAEDVENAKVNIAQNGLSLIQSVAKEGSVLAKAAGVAQATISGVQGVQNAYTTAAASPITTAFPAYPFIQAGIAGAFSAVQIGKIIKGESAKGGSSGGGTSTGAPSFNLVKGTGTDQISQTVDEQNKKPIKAYAVGSDMTTQQQLDRNIRETASL